MRKNWFSLFKSSIKKIYIPCIFKPNFEKHISLLYQSQTKFLRSSANTSQYGLHSLRVFSSKVCKMDSFIQGWNPPPPPFSEGIGVPPFSEANLKKYPLFLRAIQIGACKLYKTLQNEGVTFHTILYLLRTSLSLLFILSGSTLCLLLTLWLDIAFNVFHP